MAEFIEVDRVLETLTFCKRKDVKTEDLTCVKILINVNEICSISPLVFSYTSDEDKLEWCENKDLCTIEFPNYTVLVKNTYSDLIMKINRYNL